MTPYELAMTHMQPIKLRGKQIVPRFCPFCNGGEHRDKDTFAMDIEGGAYNCQRGSCGVKGNYQSLAKHFGVTVDTQPAQYRKPRQYKRPEVLAQPRTTQAESYLATRKISKGTMDKYGVKCDGNGNIMFLFSRGGVITFVKYRPARKLQKGDRKAWGETDAEPILYGMDLCDYDKPLVICEGEIDALSLAEAGVKNAVSVPSGCNNTDWIDNCWEWLEPFGKIILCGDADEPGREMVKLLINRLGAWRCAVVKLPDGRKDANETLYFDGPQVLRWCVEGAKDANVSGIIRLADVRMEDTTTIEAVSTGMPALDRQIDGFLMGELSVWTGKRGSGKSTVVGLTLLDAIDQGYRVCAYSGELKATRFQNWIDSQAAGPDNVKMVFSQRRGAEVPIVPSETRRLIQEWYYNAFWLYDNAVIGTPEDVSVLDVFAMAARRHGCRVFLVDNLMSSRFEGATERDRWSAQGRFVGELAAFAKKYNVHVHLVAHPRKQDKSKSDYDFDSDDIAGSSEITDRADNVLLVKRPKDAPPTLSVLKNREIGTMHAPEIGLEFCPLSRRLTTPSELKKSYGWTLPEWARGMAQEVASL